MKAEKYTREFFVEAGRKGGRRTFKKHKKEHYKRMRKIREDNRKES